MSLVRYNLPHMEQPGGIVDDEQSSAQVVDLLPDPSILSAIGAGHSLATAMADLIDNSLDKGATKFLARFITRDNELIGIRMHDDGVGMSALQLQAAMRLGARREYEAGDHGHFGVGLKAASFSQASRLTVYSRCGFEPTNAMRLRASRFEAEVLNGPDANHGFMKGASDFARVENGTVVEWDHLHSVFTSPIDVERRAWLDSLFTSLGHDLGLTFHRILARGDITIVLQQFDTAFGEGVPAQVLPVDPFAFMTGAARYPATLNAQGSSEAQFTVRCHIIQPANSGPSVKLFGRPRTEWQGLYVYRNDRLQYHGGWLNVLPASGAELQLARVAIDISSDALRLVRISPEKSGVVLTADGVRALRHASNHLGQTFEGFLQAARATLRESAIRDRGPKPMVRIGEGLPQGTIEAMESQFGFRQDGANLRVLWKPLGPGRLFELDHSETTVWMNLGYRRQLQGQTPGDAALLKSSIVMLLQDRFERGHLQQSTIDQIERLHAVLASAAFQQFDEDTYELPDSATKHLRERNVETDELEFDQWEPGDQIPLPARIDDRGFIDVRGEEAPERGSHIRNPSSDSVKDYFREISRVPLLRAEDESELAMAIEAGVLAEERLDSINEIDSVRGVLRDLGAVAETGRRAKIRFLNANLRLVVSVAKRYLGRDLDFADLIQEGNLGLLRAIEKFDYQQDIKFSTYATWWIRQSITRAIDDKSRLIRLPVHRADQLRRVRAAEAAIEAAGVIEVSDSAVAERLEMTIADINNLRSADMGTRVWSLDAPWFSIERGVDEPFGEHLADQSDTSSERIIDSIGMKEDIARALGALKPQWASVITMRYGLDGTEPHTLEAIGEHVGVSRERIRQIEQKALKLLRARRLASLLAGHLFLEGVWTPRDANQSPDMS